MSELITEHPVALQYLISEDIFLIDHPESTSTDRGSTVGEEAEKPAMPATFDYLGENNKYVVLLVDEKEHNFMAPKELEALQSILNAKKMEMKDVALVNWHKYQASGFDEIKTFFACSKMVLFGIDPAQLQLGKIAANQAAVHDGVSILATFSFSEMMNDVDKKKQFWNIMKNF